MFTKMIVTALFFASFILSTVSADRDDVINEYGPILSNHNTNLTTEYQRILQESEIVVDQLVNDTTTIITLIDSQISSLQNTIINANTIYEDQPAKLACLQTQEEALGGVSSNAINATCWNDDAFTPLTTAQGYYQLLAQVPNATISACGALDPIPSQDDLFLECVSEKISDLGGQIEKLKATFDSARNTITETLLQCLADESADLAQQINEINLQVTLCITSS